MYKNYNNEKVTTPLQQSVEKSLQEYFNNLEDASAHDLYAMVITQVELPLLNVVMHYCQGNQSKAARILGLSRNTLIKKLKLYRIE